MQCLTKRKENIYIKKIYIYLDKVSMKWMDRPSVTEMDRGGVYEINRQTKNENATEIVYALITQ